MKVYNYIRFHQVYTMAIGKKLHSVRRNEIIQRACKLLNRFKPYQQDATINEWIATFRVTEAVLRNYMLGKTSAPEDVTPIELLRSYLAQYSIRINAITGDYIIEKNGKFFTEEELELNAESDCLIHTLKGSHPVRGLSGKLKKLLNVDNTNIRVVDPFNPFKELFERLAAEYRGDKMIEAFCTYLPAHEFGDKEQSNFYKQQMDYFVKKWLCIAAGMAMGITVNDAMLLWLDPVGGFGKSYLNAWLFSLPEFREYYLRIGAIESYQDTKGISKSKFVLDYDELPLSQKRYLEFKSAIAALDVQKYAKGNQRYNSAKRLVNYVGSSNKANRLGQPGFLLQDDAAMRRRIIPLEIGAKINYAVQTNGYMTIDLYQLFGQAASEILRAEKEGNRTFMTWESDHDRLREMNLRYVDNGDAGIEKEILRRFPRANESDGKLMQPIEMIRILKSEGIKIDMQPQKLGLILKNEGYIHDRNGVRGWRIK